MDVRMPLIFVTILLFYGVNTASSAEVECNLKEFIRCSNLINKIELSNACPQISKALVCLDILVKGCGFHTNKSAPVCSDFKDYPYCSLLDGSMGAPMASIENQKHVCEPNVRLKTCYTMNCGAGGDEFKRNSERNPGGSVEEKCPEAATQTCIQSVAEVTQVNKDTCVTVAAAKNCFLDKLMDCGGSDTQQYRVDVIIAGLVDHVGKCKEQDIGFSKDGSVCVPNPLDAFIPPELEKGPPEEPNQEVCMKMFKLGNTLDNYQSTCNTTSAIKHAVQEALLFLNGSLVKCYKAGFTADSNGNNGAGIKGHHSQVVSILACVLVLAIHIFQY